MQPSRLHDSVVGLVQAVVIVSTVDDHIPDLRPNKSAPGLVGRLANGRTLVLSDSGIEPSATAGCLCVSMRERPDGSTPFPVPSVAALANGAGLLFRVSDRRLIVKREQRVDSC